MVKFVRVPPATECRSVWDMNTACCVNGSDCVSPLRCTYYLARTNISAFVCGPNCGEQSFTKHSPTSGLVTPADCAAVVAGTSIIREGRFPTFNKTSSSDVGQKNEPFLSEGENKTRNMAPDRSYTMVFISRIV